jgi:uncharacterized repeat protein (TIGR02543 family)
MDKRKILTNATVSLVAFFALLLGAVSRGGSNVFFARGDYEPYSIVLNTTKNKLATGAVYPTGYSGSGVATTELGNAVAFDYSGLINPTSNWQTIKAGGYITNTQPITGMTGMTLTKNASSADFKIYWSNTTSFTEDKSVLFDATSALTVSTSFNGYLPNYIKIYANADSAIKDGVIEFSCSNNYPSLSLSTNSSTMGTVTGDGLYAVGQSVTISATANTGYYFTGWYVGETLISTSASYTFTMPEYDVTYYAEFSATQPIIKGGTYYFGTYPQSKVTDATLLSTLNAASGTLPNSANSQAWTDYGYYINGSVSSYMWYIDVPNATDEYRGVYFTSYRQYFTHYTSSTSHSWQDDNGYTTSSVYWFKYEPITWRVLDVQSNRAFLMADLVLDSQDYHYSTSNRTIGGSTVWANNYKESHIRSWLNDNFYNTAFTAEEKARIQTTTVDNSAASTGYSTNSYACANTSDKVFLLSYAEAKSATYGLSTDASRQLQPSAYAQSQGVFTDNTNGNSDWWLRSPYSSIIDYARIVNSGGYAGSRGVKVNGTCYGVVPALWISL